MSMKLQRRVEENGAQFEFRQEVDKILVKNGRVRGVRTRRGDEIACDYVICGAYPNRAYTQMIEPKSEVPEGAVKFVNGNRLNVCPVSVMLVIEGTPEENGITNYNTFSGETMDTNEIWRNIRNITEPYNFITTVCLNYAVPDCVPEGYTHLSITNLITKELIEKYSSPDCTYMFCGPLAMFRFVSKALDEMGVAKRRFRHDVVNNPADISTLPGYPVGTEKKTFKICVVRGVREDIIEAKASESVAVALERSAIPVDTHCRNGECGFCRSQLLSGDIFVSPIGDGRREMDKEMGWFHACSSYPLSDLKIKIPIM